MNRRCRTCGAPEGCARRARPSLSCGIFLARFGFVGDRVFEPVAPFSGGEKARLVLALLVYQRPNSAAAG